MAKLSSTQIFGNLMVDGEILNKATTTTEGVVQLNDATNSTSTTQAATSNAVKKAYDLAASKANASHGNHVPTTQTANNAVFLRNDNTWQTVKPANIGAAASSHTHNYAGSSSAGGAATTALACSGNSATATKLQTARTINGTAFDGSANITITAAANGGTSSACSGNAATATKLQTARTINGTSFNGSANITTANWGTARTITVGNTGKSVNGSGNVSWSLNEIGSMPGSTVSATTAAKAGWYRIAQTTSTDQANTIGIFMIRAAVSGKHSSTILTAGVTYGQNPSIQQLSHTQYSGVGINQARIVYHTTYSGNRAYLEVYVPDSNARTIDVQLVGSMGWTLVSPSTAGSIPTGYTSKSRTLYPGRIMSDITGSVAGNASTATTLATARTINGTRFDGSANITTSKWGTARTIKIGNTAKTIDGSSNVTWTLAELGVSSIKSLHAETGGYLKKVTDTGFYRGIALDGPWPYPPGMTSDANSADCLFFIGQVTDSSGKVTGRYIYCLDAHGSIYFIRAYSDGNTYADPNIAFTWNDWKQLV